MRPAYPGSPYDRSPGDGSTGGPAAEPPYVYNPYGNYPYPASYPTSPAGLGPEPVLPPRRPGSLHLALLLVVLSAVPYLLVGLLAVAGAGQAATALPPEDLAQLQQLGVDLAQVIRITGFVMLAVALGLRPARGAGVGRAPVGAGAARRDGRRVRTDGRHLRGRGGLAGFAAGRGERRRPRRPADTGVAPSG